MTQVLGKIFGGQVQTPGQDPGMGGSPSGGWLGSIAPLALAGSGIMGTIGNFLGNRARNQVLSKEMAQMDALQKLTPAQIASGISSLQAPLSKNLTNAVSNQVQGELATRGLSQAPGIYAASLGQGIAPYQLQMQQLAQDAYFKKLGMPIQARPSPFGPFPNQTNTTGIWQQLMQRFMRPPLGGTTGTDPSGVASPEPGIISDIINSQVNGFVPPPTGDASGATGAGGGYQ